MTAGKEEFINCIVISENTGVAEYPIISSELIPRESNRRKYNGRPCHILGLDLENNLWAIEPDNEIKKDDTPTHCFIALNCEKEVNAFYSFGEGLIEKLGIGFIFALCAIELVILFLIITTATGGKVA